MASEEKFGRVKQLMSTGKEKGYVLYDEVNELLTEDYPGGRELATTAFELHERVLLVRREQRVQRTGHVGGHAISRVRNEVSASWTAMRLGIGQYSSARWHRSGRPGP